MVLHNNGTTRPGTAVPRHNQDHQNALNKAHEYAKTGKFFFIGAKAGK